MAVAGHATAEGTSRYRARHGERCSTGHFTEADRLWWSSVGLGSYLGGVDDPTDDLVTRAFARCVAGGVNVIDTAINYRYQRAERCLGRALSAQIDAGVVARDEIILCTKGGYLPHPDRADWFVTEIVRPSRGRVSLDDLVEGSHCMHPDYIDDQIERSRANLRVETIDLYYLHNPESQVGAVDERTLHDRLSAAFEILERASDEGRIRMYGLATWSAFRVPAGQRGHMSLELAKRLAARAAPGATDRLRFIQLPLNPTMPEALTTASQTVGGHELPALAACRSLGVHAITSRSVARGEIRLPPKVVRTLGESLNSDAQRSLQFARSAPAVISALAGMKSPNYVAENLGLCAIDPLPPATYASLPDYD